MKAVFIISGKSPVSLPGGLGAYANNLASIFTVQGFRVFVLGFSTAHEEFTVNDITYIHVKTPYNFLQGLGVGFITSYFLKPIQEKIARLNPEKIVIYGMATWGYAGIRLKAMRPELPITTMVSVFTTHRHELLGHIHGAPVKDYGLLAHGKYVLAYLLDRLFIQRYDRQAIIGADRIILHYESTRHIIQDDYGPIPAEKIVKTPYCVELYKRISPEQKDKEILDSGKQRPWVVVICRQDPRKGMNTFIKAIGLLKGEGMDFDCYVVGSGPFLEDNRKLAGRRGLAGEIHFLGFVDNIEPFLDQADVYVLPSVEEGSGAISLLEAMKLGVAIVTTRCDGIPEDFTHERNALLVDMHDAQDMARQIKRILTDDNLRKHLAKNASRDYREKFSFEKMAAALDRIIQEI